MNNIINTTIGIDTVIQELQTDIYDSLTSSWSGNINAYGRVYRNADSNGNTYPRVFLGDKDYGDVYYDDNYSCVYCFIDSETHDTDDEIMFTSNVRVVFMVDLNLVKPNETDRGDMEVQYDVVNILREKSYGSYNIKGIVKGVNNVFQGFDTSKIKFSDMQPYHCFGVDIKLNYYINNKCS